jgi:hypothetical protein
MQMQKALAYIFQYCFKTFNMKHSKLRQHWTQGRVARVMLAVATLSLFLIFFVQNGKNYV